MLFSCAGSRILARPGKPRIVYIQRLKSSLHFNPARLNDRELPAKNSLMETEWYSRTSALQQRVAQLRDSL